MIRFKTTTEFYEALKKDFDSHKAMEETEAAEKFSEKTYDAEFLKQSFVYTYFAKWKAKKADKCVGNKEWVDRYIINVDFNDKNAKKSIYSDKYVLLFAAHKLYTNGTIDIDKYRSVFEKIAEKEGGTKKLIKQFNEVINKVINEGINKDKESKINEAYEKLAYKLLSGVIGDKFTQKLGSSEKKGGEDEPEEDPDRLDEFNMLYEYCMRKGEDGAGVDNALSEENIKQYQELYEFLLSIEKDNVFVPLYVDPSCGAAVYILGSGHLNLSKREKAELPNLKNCGVYTSCFDSIVGYDDYYDIKCGTVKGVNMMFKYELKSFDSVMAAFADLKDHLVTDDVEEGGYLGYQNNNYTCYDSVKERFGDCSLLRCFDSPKETETVKDKYITAAEKAKEQEDKKKYLQK